MCAVPRRHSLVIRPQPRIRASTVAAYHLKIGKVDTVDAISGRPISRIAELSLEQRNITRVVNEYFQPTPN